MARARNLKPSFFANELLAEIDPLGRILFQGLWCLADREGRLEDRPKRIKAEVLPYDECDVNMLLADLAQRSFIQRYVVGSVALIQVTNFLKHQNPHLKEKPSMLPAPGKHGAGMVQASEPPDRTAETPERRPEPPERPTESPAPAVLNPDSGFLLTDSSPRNSDSPIENSLDVPASESSVGSRPTATAGNGCVRRGSPALTAAAWEAYASAYTTRYGVPPTRNANANGKMVQVVTRLGRDEAPLVAAFYVTHNGRFYVENMHPVGLLLRDAEKLRTEWATRKTVTATEARRADQRQALGNVFGALIDNARRSKDGRTS